MFCFAEASNTAVFHALCLLRDEKIEAVAQILTIALRAPT